MSERNWTEWKDESPTKEDRGEQPGQPCALNCRVAKGLKCVCSCHGVNHSALFKANNHRLDDYQSPHDLEMMTNRGLVECYQMRQRHKRKDGTVYYSEKDGFGTWEWEGTTQMKYREYLAKVQQIIKEYAETHPEIVLPCEEHHRFPCLKCGVAV